MKLQYSRTIVLLNKLELLTSSLKGDDGHAISRQEKMAFSSPSRRVALGLPSPPPPESAQAYGRMLTSDPILL